MATVTITHDGVAVVSTNVTLRAAPALRMAANGITNRNYVKDLVPACLEAGIYWGRLDVGDGVDLSMVQTSLNLGVKPLVVYNPGTGMSGGLNNRTAAQCATEVKALATTIVKMGLTEIEFGNEPWLNSDTPASYAAKYVAAHKAIAGMGVRLIAMVTGDYCKTDGTWSKTLNGYGWIGDMVAALPSPGVSQIDAWSCHPYPPVGSVTAMSNEIGGWPAVGVYRSLAVQKGSAAPWYITEVGIKQSDVGNAGQASGLTRMLNSLVNFDSGIPRAPYNWVVFFAWYETMDDSSGMWGLFDINETGGWHVAARRPVYDALKAWTLSHC